MKKTIIISGSNSQLSAGITESLSKKYDIIFLYHSKQERIKSNKSSFYIKHSLNDDVSDLFKKIKRNNTKIHSIIHFNGVHNFKPLKLITREDFNNTFEINCLTFIKLIKLAHCFDGIYTILSISSVSSKMGNKGISLYSSSKAALNNLIRSAALELSGRNTRVNNLILGHIDQGLGKQTLKYLNKKQLQTLKDNHPLGFGKVKDLFYALDFLLDSKKSRWITGSELVLDGGYLA